VSFGHRLSRAAHDARIRLLEIGKSGEVIMPAATADARLNTGQPGTSTAAAGCQVSMLDDDDDFGDGLGDTTDDDDDFDEDFEDDFDDDFDDDFEDDDDEDEAADTDDIGEEDDEDVDFAGLTDDEGDEEDFEEGEDD
jgi:hypothetical protein